MAFEDHEAGGSNFVAGDDHCDFPFIQREMTPASLEAAAVQNSSITGSSIQQEGTLLDCSSLVSMTGGDPGDPHYSPPFRADIMLWVMITPVMLLLCAR